MKLDGSKKIIHYSDEKPNVNVPSGSVVQADGGVRVGGSSGATLSLALVGTATVDFSSLDSAYGDPYGDVSQNVTVTGAALGDFVLVSLNKNLQDLVLVGHVSAANTVQLQLINITESAVDLPSGTVKVLVLRAS